MAQPVEARSLLGLTSLAANPPVYPRNPTQKPLEPLVLYIVRVPGSRDVFLSPLKPPTKSSISPASLNSSLYYLHVPAPEDEEILETIQQERKARVENNSSKFAFLNRIKRKPVPGATVQNADVDRRADAGAGAEGEAHAAAADDEPQGPPLPPRRPQTAGAESPGITNREETDQLQSQPWNNAPPPPPSYDELRRADPRDDEGRLPILPPRPLPSLPVEQEQGEISRSGERSPDVRRWSVAPASAVPSQQHPLRRLQEPAPERASWDGGRPSLRPDRSKGFLLPAELAARDRPHKFPLGRPKRSFDKPRETTTQSSSRPFHITLIRRDPTHGHQWNVGSITNTSECSSKVAPDGTVTVEITTPGYKKLAVDNSGLTLESLGIKIPTTVRSSMPLSPSMQAQAQEQQQHPTPSSPSATTIAAADAAAAPPPGPLRFIRHLSLSLTPPSPPSHHSHRPRLPHDSLSPSKLPTRARGHYTFKSPWNGHCFFITSANGRSLRCRHTLPGPSSFNSSSSSWSSRPSSPQSPSSANSPVNVAEIRFNLPTFQIPGHGHTHTHSSSYGSNGSSNSDSHVRSSDPFEEDRLDLSLARERAGGGLFGKSAKLGKLVIEDEGLKMLDLIVAACMGVFWGYYDQA